MEFALNQATSPLSRHGFSVDDYPWSRRNQTDRREIVYKVIGKLSSHPADHVIVPLPDVDGVTIRSGARDSINAIICAAGTASAILSLSNCDRCGGAPEQCDESSASSDDLIIGCEQGGISRLSALWFVRLTTSSGLVGNSTIVVGRNT
jgi:hypothetical protein